MDITLEGSEDITINEQRVRPVNSEVDRLICDNRLITELTGWETGIEIEEGLLNTIEWFKVRENLKKYKSDVYNV